MMWSWDWRNPSLIDIVTCTLTTSSLKVATDLLDAKPHSCATIRVNRVGLPDVVKKPGKLARGDSIKRQCGDMVVTVWHDKRMYGCSQPTVLQLMGLYNRGLVGVFRICHAPM